MSGQGALPDFMIEELINACHITTTSGDDAIQPSSLDLGLSKSNKLWRVDGCPLPRVGETVEELLRTPALHARRHPMGSPLERGISYIGELDLVCDMPETVYAFSNPKSSTGRDNVQVRLLADGVPRFDKIPRGFQGEVYVVITPSSYPVTGIEEETLLQVRFFTEDTRFNQHELAVFFDQQQLLWDGKQHPISFADIKITDDDGSILLTVAAPDDQVVGWECLGTNCVLDLTSRDTSPEQFFTPLRSKDGCLTLRQGGFYLLYTQEYVRVPPGFACELTPTDHRSGEFRAHFAGFVDPGWGYGTNGEGKGRQLVLEVIPAQNIMLRHGQPVAKAQYERMCALPRTHYGESGGHYGEQGVSAVPPFSKRFLRAV